MPKTDKVKVNVNIDASQAVKQLDRARMLATPCACDTMTVLFPTYHWPVCLKNPERTNR